MDAGSTTWSVTKIEAYQSASAFAAIFSTWSGLAIGPRPGSATPNSTNPSGALQAGR
jgi:hypothetical protein